MDIIKAMGVLKPGSIHKFVATLVPPMIALADKSRDPGPLHAEMAFGLGLVQHDRTNKDQPFPPIDQNNFRAGVAQVANGVLVLTGYSTGYFSSMPTPEEFNRLLGGDIKLLDKPLNETS